MENNFIGMRIPIYDDVAIEGVWLSEYGVYVAGTEGITLSILPAKTVRKGKIMDKDGEAFYGSNYEPRNIPLSMFIEDIEMFDEFKKLISFRTPKWIYFKNANLKIKALFENAVTAKPYGVNATFQLDLLAYDPYFYEMEPVTRAFTLPQLTSFTFFNDGTEISHPTYEITGKGTVNVGVNGTVMTLEFSPTEYETFVVYTKNSEVRCGSANRLYSNPTYEFPLLAPGSNPIAITGDCTSFKVTPNSKWI